MPALTQTTYRLYRFYDADGVLLYIGKSDDGLRRLVEHLRSKKRWKDEIVDIKTDRRIFATKEDVLSAEKAAIIAERPLFNIHHNTSNPDRVDPHTMRYMDGRPYKPEIYGAHSVASRTVSVPRNERTDEISPKRILTIAFITLTLLLLWVSHGATLPSLGAATIVTIRGAFAARKDHKKKRSRR